MAVVAPWLLGVKKGYFIQYSDWNDEQKQIPDPESGPPNQPPENA